MRKHFSLLPLAMLVTTAVYAENLEIINVVSENTGAKSKTNVITTESINRSTETELKGLLKDEPAINFGGGRGDITMVYHSWDGARSSGCKSG